MRLADVAPALQERSEVVPVVALLEAVAEVTGMELEAVLPGVVGAERTGLFETLGAAVAGAQAANTITLAASTRI